MSNINEAYELQNTLNPKLWDTKTMKMLPEVREKIVAIVDQFESFIDCPIAICDVTVVGSQANYNYGADSDLDVHVIANFDLIRSEDSLISLLYNAKKARFNEQYDISIRGIEVELYIEDIKTAVVSNGIYSVCEDKWIKKPIRQALPPKPDLSHELQRWNQRIKECVKSNDRDQIETCINYLYLMRKNSLSVDGEYGKGNLLFKDIRQMGGLDLLKEALNTSISKELSLESLSSGQLINSLKE